LFSPCRQPQSLKGVGVAGLLLPEKELNLGTTMAALLYRAVGLCSCLCTRSQERGREENKEDESIHLLMQKMAIFLTVSWAHPWLHVPTAGFFFFFEKIFF
jgi:hypothetical protein